LAGGLAASPSGELHFIPGGYTLTIDTAALTGELSPWRTGTGIQGKLYDLDIDNFMKRDTLQLNGLRFDGDGNVVVDYTVTHPFAPPSNLDGPATAANRADLGFTGRVLFLGDVPSDDIPNQTFFGDVVANTNLVLDADSYVSPGDLLAQGEGLNATAFPGKLIVDEAIGAGGNRIGISNGGDPRGNYDPAAGGWQRSNMGTNRNGWTGYDFLHQGQRARNAVTFDREALGANQASLAVAILIKYTDPRGVPFSQNRGVRLPQNPPDPAVFAYRVPNGALDASKITFDGDDIDRGTIDLTTAVGSSADFSILIRDWDARATETTESELSDDPALDHINIGTSGAPVVTVSMPGLVNGTVPFSAGAQTGLPGAEIAYSGTISNNLGTAAHGALVPGLVRAVDPEDTAPNREDFHFGVDPDTLAADSLRAIRVITYQALRARITRANTAPACGAVRINGSSNVGLGGTFTLDLSQVSDAENDPLDITVTYTGPAQSSTSVITFSADDLPGETAFNPFTDLRLAARLAAPPMMGDYTLTVTLDDRFADPVLCELPFTVIPNDAPQCNETAINGGPVFGDPASFTVDLSSLADGDNSNLDLQFRYSGPSSDLSSELTIATRDLGAETAFDPFADSRLAVPLSRPTAGGEYQFFVVVSDGSNTVECGPLAFTVNTAPGCGAVAINGPTTFPVGTGFSLDLSSVTDPDDSRLGVFVSYTGAATSSSGVVQLTVADETAFNPFTDARLADTLDLPPSPGFYQLFVTFSDGVNSTVCGPLPFRATGAASAPDCGRGIVLSKTGFRQGQPVEFTVDLSAITDPEQELLQVGYFVSGPSSDATSVEFMAQPLPVASNPFTDFRRDLRPPTALGTYTLEAFVADTDGSAVCIGMFSIVP
ncbi:MAG TPA: hypothetical protein VEI97_10720, partial [bacterium]|nr:hypothetical protein [bacterium]